MTQRVVGVDPGAHGALGLLELTAGFGFLDVADMPVRDRGKSVTNNVVDGKALRKLVDHWQPTIAVIEDVQPMPDHRRDSSACPACGRSKTAMPPDSAFKFGALCWGVAVTLEALGIDVMMVHPQTWKRAAGLSSKGEDGEKRSRAQVKHESLLLARQLWPTAPLGLARHENRAESLLIARYGLSSQMRFL